MSGEDSGYVPPDHKTTAEFGVTRKPAAPGEPPRPPSRSQSPTVEEVVGDYFDGDATTHDVPQMDVVGFQDLPSDDPEDDLETTYQDGPRDEPEDDFDATLQDGPPALPLQKPPPAVEDEADVTVFEAPVTFADIPMEQPAPPVPPPAVPPPAEPAAFEHGGNAAPAYGQAPPPYQERVPEPRPLPDRLPVSEQAPPGQVAAQAAAPVPAEAPWTEQFSSEGETANPAGSAPAFAYGMPGTPPPAQNAMPPAHESPVPPMPPPAMASPSGGLPGGPPGGPPAPPPRSRSGRPVLLFALIAVVAVIVLAGVAVLLLGGGSGEKGKTAKGASPAASTPAPGGEAPASPGAPSPGGGAPATPPQSGAPTSRPPGGQQPGGQPPGGQPGTPPVTTAPIGPVVQGKGVTYQLVQQDSGYFEGKMVITNRTRRPMTAWKLTFTAPGADVKNIWGARLVRGGSTVEIRNLDGVPAIQPGATWDVQFGAAGTAATPKSCRLNGRACGF